MTFGFNGPSIRPMIQEAQGMKNNGGGGNLGYFQRGKKKKEEEDQSVFDDELTEDSFSIGSADVELEPESNNDGFLDKIVKKFTDWTNGNRD